ncbi:hypothetical protein R3P38DRAFT_3387495 [Favolaschia claudopus]|uniref:Ribosome biogenesis protein SLX9 n=1 Tax=Favolaschia claudopus TaxID=2862362 RepID=A0AAW0DJ76_9AGAR
MPHKRAKRSVREQERSKKGNDLAPSRGADALSSEPLPKSFLRAINAAQVRAEFREKKRKLRDEGRDAVEGGGDQPKKKRRKSEGGAETIQRIRPGETLAHFNKRIETDMRPLVRTAVQSSLATVRAEHNKSKSKSKAATTTTTPSTSTPTPTTSQPSLPKGKPKTQPDDPPPHDKHASRPKEFAHTSTAAPRRLNDIAQAPPDLSALARKAKSKDPNGSKAKEKSILSPAQQLQMAAAREAAVARYREMKAARRAGGGAAGGERGGGAVDEGDE